MTYNTPEIKYIESTVSHFNDLNTPEIKYIQSTKKQRKKIANASLKFASLLLFRQLSIKKRKYIQRNW